MPASIPSAREGGEGGAAPALPTLERVRASAAGADELAARGEPTEARALAAIIVAIDAVKRESWVHDVEVSEQLFAAAPRDMPPVPADYFDRACAIVDTTSAPKRRRCSNCPLQEGRMACPLCGGTGVDKCLGCAASGFIPCASCDGTGVTLRVVMRHVNDRGIWIRRVVVPTFSVPLQEVVERFVHPSMIAPLAPRRDGEAPYDPNGRFRIELQPALVQSAYRGAGASRVPEFHGHRFDDALERAIEIARSLEKYDGIVRSEQRAYACPFLWLRFGEQAARELVVFLDTLGEPCIVGV